MPGSMSLNGVSVLVLEDDFYLAEDTTQALTSAGATVVGPFPTAARALQAAENLAPHCAVIDLNLGGGPDFTTAESLLGLGVPVVFITGYDSGVIPPALTHLPCLQKPAQADAIIAAVEQVCRR